MGRAQLKCSVLKKRPAQALAKDVEHLVVAKRPGGTAHHRKELALRSIGGTVAVEASSSQGRKPLLMLKNCPEEPEVGIPVVRVVDGVAVPTPEWRIVPSGVACPGGCEYRMNMSTGKNMVRLLQQSIKRTDDLQIVAAGTHEKSLRECKIDSDPRGVTAGPQQKSEKEVRRPVSTVVVIDEPSQHDERSDAQRTARFVALGRSKMKAVESEFKRAKVVTRKDGSQEEARMAVKSRELIRPKGSGRFGGREKMLSRRDETVRQLRDGRTVVTETLTVQKVTVLPK